MGSRLRRPEEAPLRSSTEARVAGRIAKGAVQAGHIEALVAHGLAQAGLLVTAEALAGLSVGYSGAGEVLPAVSMVVGASVALMEEVMEVVTEEATGKAKE